MGLLNWHHIIQLSLSNFFNIWCHMKPMGTMSPKSFNKFTRMCGCQDGRPSHYHQGNIPYAHNNLLFDQLEMVSIFHKMSQGCSHKTYSRRCTNSVGGVEGGTHLLGQENRVLALLFL